MADGLLDMIIQSADFEKLNVKPGDVLKGKLYVGPDGQVHAGEMEDRRSPTLYIDLNGRLTLPAGKYDGGEVRQSIPTMEETHITPGSKQITVYTDGMYMTGNIIVDKLSNLVPEIIKLGEYVGGVGPGTWQGYIVTDPKTFYYRGTFAPGQSISDYIAYDYGSYKADRIEDRKYMEFHAIKLGSSGGNMVYSVFNAPIDLTYVNKLVIEYSVYMPVSATTHFEAFITREKNIRYQAVDSLSIASQSVEITKKDTSGTIRTMEINVSALSRSAYLSLFVSFTVDTFKLFLHSVKFE